MTETTAIQQGAFRGIDIPSNDIITNCIHCGLCLPHCPTYALTGNESSSPRGRIRLIKSVADGVLPISAKFIDEMNFCLDCQACETACPAGVQYGSLVEAARAQIFEQGHEGWFSTLTKKVFLGWFFVKRSRLQRLARFLRIYERSGLKTLMRSSGILAAFSQKLGAIQDLAPSISQEFSSMKLPTVVRPEGSAKYRVGFLTGCIMDVAYSDVNTDTVDLLVMHGCEVVIPPLQECCGSLQAHNGDRKTARKLASQNIEAFRHESLDAIVINSAGCGAFMKEYGHLFGDDPKLAGDAQWLSSKTKDITEFLATVGFKSSNYSTTPGGFLAGKRVTYHDACHLVHTQKITKEPRRLITSIPGIQYVELEESTWCCGSAGIYNIVRYQDSMDLLDRKVQNVKAAKPDIIVTGNPGCMVQIQHGLRKEGIAAELMHTATFLRKACAA